MKMQAELSDSRTLFKKLLVTKYKNVRLKKKKTYPPAADAAAKKTISMGASCIV